MKIQKTETLALSFGNEVYTNTYVSNYSGETEIKFHDYQTDGAEFKVNINVPIETARSILTELQQDLENYPASQLYCGAGGAFGTSEGANGDT